MVENRLFGYMRLQVEPFCFAAVWELEALTLDRDAVEFKDLLALNYAEMVYAGRWFDPLRESMDAFMVCSPKTQQGFCCCCEPKKPFQSLQSGPFLI